MSDGSFTFAQLVWSTVLGIGGAAGIFFAGHQFGTSELQTKVEEAREKGKAAGLEQAILQHQSQENQTELIARLFGIIRNPELLQTAPASLLESVWKAENALARGDFEAALQSLPKGVFEAPPSPCVMPNARYLMDAYAKFDVCEVEAAITLDGINVIGRLDLFANGVNDMLSPGEKVSVAPACSLQFVRTEDLENFRLGVLIELLCAE